MVKKMLKKVLSLVLAGAMMTSFAGCSKKDVEQSSADVPELRWVFPGSSTKMAELPEVMEKANEIIEALKNTDFNIVEIPQDQNFKSATIFRKTIQQQGAKANTLDAFKKLADLLR